MQGRQRGPIHKVKNKLQKGCEVVDVDEFHTSKLCCHCHCKMAKVKYNGKEINSSIAVTMSVMISMVQGTFICYLRRWFRKKDNLKHSAVQKLMGLEVTLHCKRQ
jgi:hypothetical protein